MDYVNSDRLLFVLASPAGGGYRLARIISCFDNVHWYSCQNNGLHPWSVVRANPENPSLSPSKVKGRNISKYHFDRRTENGMIPLLGERIEKFWESHELDVFYKENWNKEFLISGGADIVASGKYVLWVLHDIPETLENKFPNSKIISLLDDDVYEVIRRYLTTTALFPFKIENRNLKPIVDNQVSKNLSELEKLNPNPTYRDYWAWTTKGVAEYSTVFNEDYIKYVSNIIFHQQTEMSKENPKCLNITWDSLDVNLIKEFIGAGSIDPNYINLINR
jgi:hypothetical protein